MERETGFEPATPSLEGWRSTAELFPRSFRSKRPTPTPMNRYRPTQLDPVEIRPATRRGPDHPRELMVGRGGFEPPKAFASRFTVCPLWPLGYLPEPTGMCVRTPRNRDKSWRWREDLNPRPTA